MVVRETAAEQLEERQSDWAYSRPVVILDILWNLAFVAVAAGVLVASKDERPAMPLRLWIVGYAVQCAAHMVCVCIEYRRRTRRRSDGLRGGEGSSGPSSPRDLEEGAGYESEPNQDEEGTRYVKVAFNFVNSCYFVGYLCIVEVIRNLFGICKLIC